MRWGWVDGPRRQLAGEGNEEASRPLEDAMDRDDNDEDTVDSESQ